MSDLNGNPNGSDEEKFVLSEQQEAQLASFIEKSGDGDIRDDVTYKTRIDLYNAFIEAGVPKETVQKFIGKFRIIIEPKAYGSPLYNVTLETVVKRMTKLYVACVEDMSEQAFVDVIAFRSFIVTR